MGMEMSLGARRNIDLNYLSLASLGRQRGGAPLGGVTQQLGEYQRGSSPFVDFAGVGFGMDEDQMRGTTGYTPLSARLTLPYGEGLYGLAETYMEDVITQHRQGGQEFYGHGIDVLRQTPSTHSEIRASEAWVQMLEQTTQRGPGLSERLVGQSGIETEYVMGKRGNQQPTLELGAQIRTPMQSGVAWDIPGVKGATSIRESLTAQGADPRTQVLVGGDSMKGNLSLISGLAQTLEQQDWAQFLPEGYDPAQLYDQQGIMQYTGQPEVQHALEQMLGPQKEQFAEVLEQRGGFYRESQWRFSGTADDPFLKQNPRVQEMLSTGQAQYTESGHIQMMLQSVGLPTVGSPIYPFRGRQGGLSLNAMQDIYSRNPEAVESFLDPERAPDRAPYLNFMQAAGQLFPQNAQFLPEATGQQPYQLPVREAWQSFEKEFGGEVTAAERSRSAMPPLAFLLEQMEQSYGPDKFLPVRSAGQTAFMNPGASRKLGEFDDKGRAKSSYSIKQATMLSAIHTGGIGPLGLSPLVNDYVTQQRNLAQQPATMAGVVGGDITQSAWGRATYAGTLGLPEGEAALVLPERFIKENQLGESIRGNDLMALVRREPSDVESDIANTVFRVLSPSQANRMAKLAGEDPVSVPYHGEAFGIGAQGETFRMILSAFGMDFDKDLLEGLLLNKGYTKEQANAAMQEMIGNVLPGLPMTAKGHEMLEKAGMSPGEYAVANRPDAPTQISSWTQEVLAGAQNERKTGLVSNMLDLMKAGMRTRAESMTGGERDLYELSAKAAEREIGGIKEDLIESRRDQPLPPMVTAAMSASAFKGARHGEYDITFLSQGWTSRGGTVRPETQRIHPMELFTGFAASALEQGMSRGGVAALFGGYADEEGALQGLPTSVAAFIDAEAREKGSGKTPFLDDPTAGVEWLETTPKGRLELGRLYYKSMNRMFYLDELKDDAMFWEKDERDFIRSFLESGAGDEMMLEYEEAYGPEGMSRKAGAIRRGEPGSDLHKFSGLNRLVQAVQARAEQIPMLGDILGRTGLLELEAGERVPPSQIVRDRPRPLSAGEARAEQLNRQAAAQDVIADQAATAASGAGAGTATVTPEVSQRDRDPYRPSNLGKEYEAYLQGKVGWGEHTAASVYGDWEHKRYERETLAEGLEAELTVKGTLRGRDMEGTMDRYDPNTGDIIDRKTGRPTEEAVRRHTLQVSAYRHLAQQEGRKVGRIGLQYGKYDDKTGTYDTPVMWVEPTPLNVLEYAAERLEGQIGMAEREAPHVSAVLEQQGMDATTYPGQIAATGQALETSRAI
ncbi:MAG: hypothetical protein ACYSTZ_03040, partial [Planctomycetota bacterium]